MADLLLGAKVEVDGVAFLPDADAAWAMVLYVAAVAAADDGGATVPAVLRERAELAPDARAVTHGGASATYAQLLARAEAAAARWRGPASRRATRSR